MRLPQAGVVAVKVYTEFLMCLAVPVRVIAIEEGGMVRCQVGEGQTSISASCALLESGPEIGDYLIVHAGFALRKLALEDALETLGLLRAMVAGND